MKMDIEKAFKAMLEQQVRQSEALEGIYSCLQVLVKRGEAAATEDKAPAKASTRQRKNVEREEPPAEEPEAEEPPVEEADPLEEPEAPPAKEPTSDDVKAALANYRNINGTPAMMKLFAKYGASGMGTLKPEDYAGIINDAK
jgi:hypothetical protein